jgi:uncharacterized membrane protein YdjX (TVP38/TMEM64 family)
MSKIKLSPFLPAIFLAAFISVLPMLGSALSAYFIIENATYFSNVNISQLVLWTLIWAFACAFALLNPTFLAGVYGYILGFKGFWVIIAINLLAILGVYGAYRLFKFKYFDDLIKKNPRALQLVESLKTDELKVVFFTKLSPVLPFTLTNLTFAVARVNVFNMLIGGFLGMIPRTFLAIYAGSQAKNIYDLANQNSDSLFGKIILIVLFFISLAGLFYFVNKALKNKV